MESVLGRYKNLIVLVVVLFAQVLGLAVQVKRTTDTESSRLIRVWTVSAVTPFEEVFVWMHNGSGNLWHNYFYLRGVRAENRELKQQIEQLRLEQVRLSGDAAQARRLQVLFGFKEQFVSKTIAAQVIGSGGSEQSRIVYIDKGESDGVKTDMAVITVNGIVGKVLKIFRSTSQVLLIDDQSSGVGAILEKSRLQGIVRGTPAGEVVLEKIMTDESVQPGEAVLTSGGDRIFPKGLPVGVVTHVANENRADLFLNIRVRPAANLNKLEEVLVVTKVDEKEPAQSETGPVRAADILAQRLPSVPDKPASLDPAPANGGANGAQPGVTPKPPVAKAPSTQPSLARPGDAAATAASKPGTVVPARPASSSPAAKPAETTPSALKPATEQRPEPTPVKVLDASQVAAKPKQAPAPATPPPAKPQEGPQ
jgi:rod shape-determining protein MreC